MIDPLNPPQWHCIGCSVRGASHFRNELPNQDAIAWYPNDPEMGSGTPLILAIADGHGSPKSFRSDVGSKLAVETAIRLMHEFFIEGKPRIDVSDLKTVNDVAHNLFPQRLVYEWSISVQQHWQKHPLTENDSGCDRLIQKEGEAVRSAIEQDPKVAYGTTLLTVLITESFILYVQLGDGDIVCIDAQGAVTRPLSHDPKLMGNETTSLCMVAPWQEFRITLEQYPPGKPETMPALILVSTDGYANSFPSEAEFLKIAPDYLQMTREGLHNVASQLPKFLEETSLHGSGDDITLGMIKRWEPSKDIADTLNFMKTQQDQQSGAVIQLGESQKKTNRVLLYMLTGVAVTFLMTIATIPVSYFWFTRPAIEQKAEQQQKAIEALQRRIETLEKSTKSPPKDSKPSQQSSPN